jgi:hypothetical protein
MLSLCLLPFHNMKNLPGSLQPHFLWIKAGTEKTGTGVIPRSRSIVATTVITFNRMKPSPYLQTILESVFYENYRISNMEVS